MPSDLQSRIAARKLAKDVAEVVKGEASSCGEDEKHFWSKLKELLFPPEQLVEKPLPHMSDAWRAAFEGRRVPYGKYVGDYVSRVPLKYLDWLIGQGRDDFKRDVALYMARPDIQAQLRAELEGHEDDDA